MIINEVFDLKSGKFKRNDGQVVSIIYINPETSESTYQYKDILEKYGAFRNKETKPEAWSWVLGDNPEETYTTKIKPCIEELVSFEKVQNGKRREITSVLDELSNMLQTIEFAPDVSIPDNEKNLTQEQILEKVSSLKTQLINAVSDEEFKKLIEPIMKFKEGLGHEYSFLNTILIMVQDPKATVVKSMSNWLKLNRAVLAKSKEHPICLIGPSGDKNLSKEDIAKIKTAYLRSINKTEKQLNPTEREELQIMTNNKSGNKFKILPYFHDIRNTVQIRGKEVLMPDKPETPNWHDTETPEDEKSNEIYEAVSDMIISSGIDFKIVDDLGGAMGVSKSGAIDIVKSDKKSPGLVNTLIHEFSHELLHQKFLKNRDKELSNYFVGTSEGRAKVEQQAELSAWIVLKSFGYDLKTNINYIGLWGLKEKDASTVFDSVANVASFIIKGIRVRIYKEVKEDFNLLEKINEISGLDVAKIIGAEDIYMKSKEINDNGLEENTSEMLEEFHIILKKLI